MRHAFMGVLYAIALFHASRAAAEVLELSADGASVTYATPGVYSDGVFHPLSAAGAPSLSEFRVPDSATAALLLSSATRYALDPDLLTRVAWTESRYHPDAISRKGAIGVMQLMKDTARDLGINPYDPAQNILGGAAYLRKMLDRYDGNIMLAVAAYNAGPEATDLYRGIPPFPETVAFVHAVLGEGQAHSNSSTLLVVDQ